MLPQLAVCIPAYEMGGKGAAFLRHCLESLVVQRGCSFEVIVSDQCSDGSIRDVCASFSERLSIRRVDGTFVKRSASANLSVAIDSSRANTVKVLFQDDYLIEPESLSETLAVITSRGGGWAVCGSRDVDGSLSPTAKRIPRFHDSIHFGRNTISSPSVLAFRKHADLVFDRSLEWLMDVDFYYQAFLLYGPPLIIEGCHVANRLHAHQVSQRIDTETILQELSWVRSKYRHIESSAQRREYYRQYFKNRVKKWLKA